jgi:hypothetical protein
MYKVWLKFEMATMLYCSSIEARYVVVVRQPCARPVVIATPLCGRPTTTQHTVIIQGAGLPTSCDLMQINIAVTRRSI